MSVVELGGVVGLGRVVRLGGECRGMGILWGWGSV